MSLPDEAVTQAGSGLVFINYYSDTVTDAYRNAIIAAEHELQSHFTDSVTVGVGFDYRSLGANFSGQNSFTQFDVGYTDLTAALKTHATTADDLTAVAGLPASDPSAGTGFSIASAQARILGLAGQSNIVDDAVVLNSDFGFTFGQDAIGVLEHEITEGVLGRVASLGYDGGWGTLDLFRFTADGQRDYTGGQDGKTTYFGIDSAHVTGPAYHNAIDAAGHDDGYDLGDWDSTRGDAFGPGGPGSPGVMTPADLQVLDVLGWTPSGSGAGYTPAPDDFASSLGDASAPFGALAVGGSATGALQTAGDRDLFRVTLQAGTTYTVTMLGHASGGGSVGDTYLRLDDGTGATVASNDDIVSGDFPDSRIVFTPTTTGTYYVEAGAFVDGYTGTYRLDLAAGAPTTAATSGPDVLMGGSSGVTINAGVGNDTVIGGNGQNYLRGDDGADIVNGGPQFDDINGNMGNDTLHGGDGGDWVVGGKDNDLQYGDDGDDIVLGNLGDDTLDGGFGNDIVRGGQGDDVLTGGPGDDYVSGDRGNDTETGGAGADSFHTFGDAGIDRVLDFHISEGDRVQLDPGTTYTVAQVGADTVISMTGGAQMILVGVTLASLPDGWIFIG